MTGDRQIYMVWHLQATMEKIDHATSDIQVHDGLEWHKGQSEQLQKALKFLTADDKFTTFQPLISDIINDPDVRCAYREYRTDRDGLVEEVAVWVCSPQANKIAYLSCP